MCKKGHKNGPGIEGFHMRPHLLQLAWSCGRTLETTPKKHLKRKKFRQKLRMSLKDSNLKEDGFRCLEVGPTACQTYGLPNQIDCSCNWLLLLQKNRDRKSAPW